MLSFFVLLSSGLSAVGDSDHQCSGWGDQLLIEEWNQVGAFPLPANNIVMALFCEGLKAVGEPGGSHSESVPDSQRTLSH